MVEKENIYEEVKAYFISMGCSEENAEESTKELATKGQLYDAHYEIYYNYNE